MVKEEEVSTTETGMLHKHIQFYVYIHIKPNGDPFYVGKGHGKRSHRLSRKNLHHKSIVKKYGGRNIGILVFPRDSEQEAFQSEVLWIKILREAGFRLANKTDGGEGTVGCSPSIETKTKLSEIGKKRCSTIAGKDHIKVMSDKSATRLKEQWKDPEYRIKMTAISEANKNNPEYCAKMSEQAKKYWANPEHTKSMSERIKKRWEDPTYKEGRIQATKEMWKNQEHRNNISEKMKDKWTNPEYLAKMKAKPTKGKNGLQKNNTSGYPNISFDKESNKWIVMAKREGKRYKLGRFKTIEEALCAQEAQEALAAQSLAKSTL